MQERARTKPASTGKRREAAVRPTGLHLNFERRKYV
jgi:hypothetical protein